MRKSTMNLLKLRRKKCNKRELLLNSKTAQKKKQNTSPGPVAIVLSTIMNSVEN